MSKLFYQLENKNLLQRHQQSFAGILRLACVKVHLISGADKPGLFDHRGVNSPEGEPTHKLNYVDVYECLYKVT